MQIQAYIQYTVCSDCAHTEYKANPNIFPSQKVYSRVSNEARKCPFPKPSNPGQHKPPSGGRSYGWTIIQRLGAFGAAHWPVSGWD